MHSTSNKIIDQPRCMITVTPAAASATQSVAQSLQATQHQHHHHPRQQHSPIGDRQPCTKLFTLSSRFDLARANSVSLSLNTAPNSTSPV
jgi:hypothetical protein